MKYCCYYCLIDLSCPLQIELYVTTDNVGCFHGSPAHFRTKLCMKWSNVFSVFNFRFLTARLMLI